MADQKQELKNKGDLAMYKFIAGLFFLLYLGTQLGC